MTAAGAAALLACGTLLIATPEVTDGLAPLVRAYRAAPAPDRKAAVEAFAAAHPDDTSGDLARLALGVAAYEQKDYAGAIEGLTRIQSKLPQIADYTAYYLAAARVEASEAGGASDPDDVVKDLQAALSGEMRFPLAGRAWLLEGRALKASNAAEAVRVLRAHYTDLPQPEGDLTLADCYQTANDLKNATEYYRRVYYQYPVGDAAAKAAAAIAGLKDAMGAAFPQPAPKQLLRRADRLLELRNYPLARSEYQSIAGQLAGFEHDRALVGIGAADFLNGKTPAASVYLHGLNVPVSEADAERLFYIEECARRLNKDEEIKATLARMAERYPKSPWRLKALAGAANRYLLANRPAEYVPIYRTAYEDFPKDPAAASYHWKVVFQAYLHDDASAGDLLRAHLRTYPGSGTAGAALYFLARQAERRNDFGSAHVFYGRLAETFPNQYYGMLARDRFRQPEVEHAAPTPAAEQFLAMVTFAQPKPIPAQSTRATALRVDRSRLLRAAGLNDLADGELRFGARTDCQPALIAMEMASTADAPYLGIKIMKSLTPDYLSLPVAEAPRPFWEYLFPMPYRSELVADAEARGLDPYVIAGLIRQESEFNQAAVWRVSAYGLTQVMPGTGRDFARKAGIEGFTAQLLFEPAANLKIGTLIFRSMLDRNGGKLEQTLAAYNAGPSRVADWITWNTYREPAEFVESIPFIETREYVQGVLRNADMYRRLYR